MTEYQEVSVETQAPDRTEAPTQFRTSEMTPLLAVHGDLILSYAPVQFDAKPERKKAIGKNGRAFGSIETCEAIPMSYDNTRWMLAGWYGMTVAESMICRADAGEYVFGEKRDLEGRGSQGRIKGGMNVAKDQSRESGYVVQVISFVQGGIK